MREEYDFSKARPNPYAKKLKQPVTIRLDMATVAYFKMLADKTVIPYQTLINLYLRDCASSRRKLSIAWLQGGKGQPSRKAARGKIFSPQRRRGTEENG